MVRKKIYASIKSFNPAFGLLMVNGILGECGISNDVHGFLFFRKISKRNNFFLLEIEEGHIPNYQDGYGPNHNGTIVLSIRRTSRFEKMVYSLFEDKAYLAKQELLK